VWCIEKMKLQESGENYLEAILILEKRNGIARSVDVANELGFSKPSVSRAMAVLKEAGYVNTDSAATNNPTVLWITDKLLRNYPVYMAYGINVNGSRSGHAISILGYRKAKASSDGKTYDFLQVYNSWDDTYAFLNYSTVDFMDCRAVCFDVRK